MQLHSPGANSASMSSSCEHARGSCFRRRANTTGNFSTTFFQPNFGSNFGSRPFQAKRRGKRPVTLIFPTVTLMNGGYRNIYNGEHTRTVNNTYNLYSVFPNVCDVFEIIF